jgi:hypothetical protein
MMKPSPTAWFAVLAILIAGSPAVVKPQAQTSTNNDTIPFDANFFVPCAAGGAGEIVALSGQLHVLIHVTVNDVGGTNIKTHFQPQGISGVGLITGDTYRGTGVTQDQESNTGATEFTAVNNVNLIGPGPGNNLLVHQLIHITINPNGELTAVVVNSNIDCK